MRYVTVMGCLVQLTNKQWRDFLEHRATNEDVGPEAFGKILCNDCPSVTDWTPADASDALREDAVLNRTMGRNTERERQAAH